jgi:hypothetical protein
MLAAAALIADAHRVIIPVIIVTKINHQVNVQENVNNSNS